MDVKIGVVALSRFAGILNVAANVQMSISREEIRSEKQTKSKPLTLSSGIIYLINSLYDLNYYHSSRLGICLHLLAN